MEDRNGEWQENVSGQRDQLLLTQWGLRRTITVGITKALKVSEPCNEKRKEKKKQILFVFIDTIKFL